MKLQRYSIVTVNEHEGWEWAPEQDSSGEYVLAEDVVFVLGLMYDRMDKLAVDLDDMIGDLL